MRRAVMAVAIVLPTALIGAGTAGADEPRPAGPAPTDPPRVVAATQTAEARQDRWAADRQTSLRGKGLRADDDATPPSLGTAPAMSASSPLAAAPGGAPAGAFVHTAGARAPPPGAGAAANASQGAGPAEDPAPSFDRLPRDTRGRCPRDRQEVPQVGYDFGVGREAPTFSLNAVDGSEIKLGQYRGDWFPVLVFVPARAPGAADALAELSTAAGELWGLRGQLVGLCDGDRDECSALAARVPGLAFPLLPDDGTVARQYGALRDDGTARPMAFIVDRAGKIVWTGEGPAALTHQSLLAAFRQVVR